MKKLFLVLSATAIIAVAALNVNVSLGKKSGFNVSLAGIMALADPECYVPTFYYGSPKMRVRNFGNSSLTALVVENAPSGLSTSHGLVVNQTVLARRNVAVMAHAAADFPMGNNSSSSSGVVAVAGNAQSGSNWGVYAGLVGCNDGTAIFATSDYWNHQIFPVNGRYAGYFQGNVRMSGNVSVGSVQNTAFNLHVQGNIGVNGNLLQTSDSRSKTDVKNLRSALAQIAKLRPVTYNTKPEDLSEYYELVPDSIKIGNDDELRSYFGLTKRRDEDQRQIGFIAQEMRAVFPELVHEDDNEMLSVNYIALIPVLAGAIQEQDGTIQQQNSIIQQQNETIRQMNDALQVLSQRLEALENGKAVVNSSAAAGNLPDNNFSFTLFPNPTSSGFVTVDYIMYTDAPILIELYSAMGQRLRVLLPNQSQKAGAHSVHASVAGINPGAYLVRAVSGNQVESKQLVIN